MAELARRTNVASKQVEALLRALTRLAYREAPSPGGFTIPGLCTLKVVSGQSSSHGSDPERPGADGGNRKELVITPNEQAVNAVLPKQVQNPTGTAKKPRNVLPAESRSSHGKGPEVI